MNSIDQSQIFFLISSVGFIILGGLVAGVLVYVLRALRIFENILSQINKDIASVGVVTKEMLEDMRMSVLYKLITFKRVTNRKK